MYNCNTWMNPARWCWCTPVGIRDIVEAEVTDDVARRVNLPSDDGVVRVRRLCARRNRRHYRSRRHQPTSHTTHRSCRGWPWTAIMYVPVGIGDTDVEEIAIWLRIQCTDADEVHARRLCARRNCQHSRRRRSWHRQKGKHATRNRRSACTAILTTNIFRGILE